MAISAFLPVGPDFYFCMTASLTNIRLQMQCISSGKVALQLFTAKTVIGWTQIVEEKRKRMQKHVIKRHQ